MLEILQANKVICSEVDNLTNSLFYLGVLQSKLISINIWYCLNVSLIRAIKLQRIKALLIFLLITDIYVSL